MQGYYNAHRLIRIYRRGFFVVSLTAGLTTLLTGCFNNISGSDSAKKTSSQNNFNDTGGGGTPNGNFDGTNLIASTELGGIVGSYTDAPYTGKLGLMLNLQLPLVNAVGEDVLNDLLNRVDAESAVQNIAVTIRIPQFGIKVEFKFGKIAFGNAKRLRKVMSLRPGLSGVDIADGYIPEKAPVTQQTNGNIFTYGGLLNGSPIARLTILWRGTDVTNPGFLPNISNQFWGLNYPDGDAQENAVFMPLTEALGKIYHTLYTSPHDSNIWAGPAGFSDTGSNSGNYLLSIHRDASNKVTKAYIFKPTVAAPEGYLLCSAAANDLEKTVEDQRIPATGYQYSVADSMACDCSLSNGGAGPAFPLGDPIAPPRTSATQIVETCGAGFVANDARVAPNKAPYLAAAIASRPATPATGQFPISTKTYSGVTISPF